MASASAPAPAVHVFEVEAAFHPWTFSAKRSCPWVGALVIFHPGLSLFSILGSRSSMATLAAIPEAASYLLDRNIRYRDSLPTASFHRPRPKSRVVILSKRSGRVCAPIRKQSPAPESPGSVYSSESRQAPEQHYADSRSHNAHKSAPNPSYPAQADNRTICGADAPFRGSSMRSLDAASSVDNSWEPSELSLDLDAFPMPPLKDPLRQPAFASSASAAPANPPRIHATAMPNPMASACLPKTGFSSPQAQKKSHVYMKRSPHSPQNWLLDGTADFASASKHTSIDSALVEAISRSVCQQLRLFNAISRNNQDKRFSRTSRGVPTSQHKNHSRIPNRSNSLERFTGRRHGQPEGARVPKQRKNPLATPAKSGISLHTVSPLRPFRPEFRAAGLAVTSKDQKRNFPAYIAKLISSKSSRKTNKRPPGKRPKVSRFDGFDEGDSNPSSLSEISFAASQDLDEWRYALIEEAPVRKQKRQPVKEKKKSKRHWFSCFPKDEESVADGE
ncbi:hypothetical protein ACSS6W_006556 [Trichoderma asperelloides]